MNSTAHLISPCVPSGSKDCARLASATASLFLPPRPLLSSPPLFQFLPLPQLTRNFTLCPMLSKRLIDERRGIQGGQTSLFRRPSASLELLELMWEAQEAFFECSFSLLPLLHKLPGLTFSWSLLLCDSRNKLYSSHTLYTIRYNIEIIPISAGSFFTNEFMIAYAI